MAAITRVSITEFTFDVENFGLEVTVAGNGNVAYEKGARYPTKRLAIQIDTDAGVSGEYVVTWASTSSAMGQAAMLIPLLVGKNPHHREKIYEDMKCEVPAYDHIGHGMLDIALWDLCGKLNAVSVKSMLGGYRDNLPTYASTYFGQEKPGGLCTPEAFADFAEQCKEAGFHGFKIHGWQNGEVKREKENLRGVRKRVGNDWRIMLDPVGELNTWMEALEVGHVCDEINCFWYEDPYKDSSISAEGHRRLRERLKTPLLLGENIRGVELKAAFMNAGGCDMLHVDPDYDMGITGTMKLAHFCEAMGLDLQLHAVGPAQRLCMSAIRNTHMYEMAMVGPDMPNLVAPVYTCGYSDQADDLPSNGCVPVPDGPGLGVSYDWEFIEAHKTNEFSC